MRTTLTAIKCFNICVIGGWLLAGVADAQIRSWPDPVANHVIPMQATPVTHGPILGAVTSSSVRVWLRSREAIPFEVLMTPGQPPLSPSVWNDAKVVAGSTEALEDFTGYVQIDDLLPATEYVYAVRVGDDILDPRDSLDTPWPSFRTLPDATTFAHPLNPEGKFNFAFSIGACQRQRSPENTYGIYPSPPAFDTLYNQHRDKIAFHIVNGDYTYEELNDGTVAGIENNYKLYLSRGRSLNRFLQSTPLVTMYNDHEVTSNIDGAGEVGLGDGPHMVRDPALRVWQYYADWSNGPSPFRMPIRFGEAQLTAGSNRLVDPNANFSSLNLDQVSTLHVGPFALGGDATTPAQNRGGENVGVYEVKNVLDRHTLQIAPPAKTDSDAPYSLGTHHYFDRVIGNCHFFYLDTRGERSKFLGKRHARDRDRFVLGDVQKEWFIQGVQNTDAEFIFVVSPDPWFIYHSNYHMRGKSTDSKGDGYCGYVAERQELTKILDDIEKPVLLLTGDVHHPVAAQITDNVWEFLISPVNSANHPLGTAGLPPLGGWFDSEGTKIKIKWIGGYPDNVHYLRQRNTVYGVVQINNLIHAPRPDGPGYQFIAYDEPQVMVRFHDGYTGELIYAEGISTLDAKPEGPAAAKVNRFGHWNRE